MHASIRSSMQRVWFTVLGTMFCLSVCSRSVSAQQPLHQRIDDVFARTAIGPVAPAADDFTFARRVHLDLIGRIPSAAETRAFLADTPETRRTSLVDRLLNSPEYPRHMANVFDVMLMERRGGKHIKSDEFRAWLRSAFEQNTPFHTLASEVIAADTSTGKNPAAAFIMERDAEPNLVTREVSRMFFGRDLQCAQCHDHPNVDDYKQEDYYGVFAFVNRTSLFQPDKKKPAVLSEAADGQASFKSVFTERAAFTSPRMPGEPEFVEPIFVAGDEYKVRPTKTVAAVPKFSRRMKLAELVATGQNEYFRRNIANRLWAYVMGRGLVHPVDMHHSANPPSNPEMMALLADEIAAMNFDVKNFLRELVLTQAYQRSHNADQSESVSADEIAAAISQLEQLKEAAEAASTKKEEEAAAALDSLDKAIAAAEPIRAAWAKLRSTATSAAAKHATAVTTRDTKQAALNQKQSLSGDLTAIIGHIQKATAAIGESKELTSAANLLKTKSEKLNAESKKLQTELEAAIKAATATADALSKANVAEAAEREKLAPLTQAMRDQRKALVKSLSESQQAWEQVTHAEKKNEFLNGLLILTKANRDLPATNQQIAVAQSKRSGAAEAMVDAEQEMAEVSAAVADMETDHRAKEQFVSGLQNEMAQRQKSQQLLTESLGRLEAAAKLLSDGSLAGSSAVIRRSSEALASSVEKTQAEMNKANKDLVRLTAELDEMQKQATQTQQRAAAAKEELGKIESEIARLRKQLEELQQAATESGKVVAEKTTIQFQQRPIESLTPEQLAWSILQASGQVDRQIAADLAKLNKEKPLTDEQKADAAAVAKRAEDAREAARVNLEKQVASFVNLFGAESGQPQDSFFATVDQALFFANGSQIRGWLAPSGDNLTGRLLKLESAEALAEELYLSMLIRQPTKEEISDVQQYLSSRGEDSRKDAVQELAWALVTSAEFRFQF